MSLVKITDEIAERFYPAVTHTTDCHTWTVLGLHNEANDNYNLLTHILLIFKCYIYRSREKWTLNIHIPIANLIKVKKRQKQISIVTITKREAYEKKWCITDKILPVT